MKTMLSYGFGLFSFLFILWGCGSTQTAAEKEMLALEVREAVEQPSFRFNATYAYPTGYQPVYLSPYYDVEVTSDTVKAYLPYYGRAYRAPVDPREGGFQFTSTDFTYRYRPGKSDGNWIAHITILDMDRPVTFRFDIWENGSSRLMVNDFNRQPISFQGDVGSREEKKE
ncbi:MAG TPA: DUF4251 domain-containing protein [Bacteroidales bacterium]|nr:DUF4251 domain-containing protein [Bacteroidales bacterium]